MPTLPKELIIEIFTRLPVKSLCRFKCLSKSYQYLICHPLFVKMHLSRAQTLGRTKLLGDGIQEFFDIDLDLISRHDRRVSLRGLEFPECRPFTIDFNVCLGSCNGLLCIVNDLTEFWLGNPSIRESENVRGICDSFLNGFGYAESIDDYKIVTVACPGSHIRVYSVKNSSWKTIESDFLFPKEYFNEDPMVEYCNVVIALNGAVHWAFQNDKGLCVIAAFDLVEEKFKMLPPPENVHVGKRGAWFHCGWG